MADKQSFADYMHTGEVPLPQGGDGGAVSPLPLPASVLPPYTEGHRREAPERYCRNGEGDKTLRKLRKTEAERRLDLHGMFCKQAHAELEEFLKSALANGIRVVEVIHGRGAHSASKTAVLRDAARTWLRQCDYVLAYCEPLNNSGCVQVLLKGAGR